MTTGQNLIDAARVFLGEPYSTGPGRTSPTSGYKDCSGLVAAAYEVATGRLLGADVSVTIYDLCVSQGLWIPREFAHDIAGTCVFMPEDPYQGWGSAGHIGFSDGFGGTVEATPPMVQNLPFNYQPWGSNACMLPGINYDNYGHGSDDEEDDMPKGFFAKERGGPPFVWYISPDGYRMATTNENHINLMGFFGFTSGGNSVSELSKADLEAFPIWDPNG